MLEEIRGHVRAGRAFAFETTLAGLGFARLIPRWRKSGYRIKLIYLRVSTVELALSRVAGRVLQGGHDVPADVVRRRFMGGWRNFEEVYKPLVDAWELYDNSGQKPVRIAEGRRR